MSEKPTIIRPIVKPITPIIGQPKTPIIQTIVPQIITPIVQPVTQPTPSIIQPIIPQPIRPVIRPITPIVQAIAQPITPIFRSVIQPTTPVIRGASIIESPVTGSPTLRLIRTPIVRSPIIAKVPSTVHSEELAEQILLDIPKERYRSPVVKYKMRQNPKISILYRVVKNVLTMLRQRGYTIPAEFDDLNNLTANQFITVYMQKVKAYNNSNPGDTITLRQFLSRDFSRDDPTNPDIINVYYPETPKGVGTTKKSQIDRLVSILGNRLNSNDLLIIPAYRAMIISEYPLSSQAKTSLGDFPKIRFETFTYQDIVFLSSEHFLVPKHEKVPTEQVEEMVNQGISLSRMKTIAHDDPISRESEFNVGDVIKIIRRNYTYNHPIPVTVEYRRVSRRSIDPKK